jgi:hypothetical protein
MMIDSSASAKLPGKRKAHWRERGEVRVLKVSFRILVLEDCVVITVNQIIQLSQANVVLNLRCIDIDADFLFVEESCETRNDIFFEHCTAWREPEQIRESGRSITKAEPFGWFHAGTVANARARLPACLL